MGLRRGREFLSHFFELPSEMHREVDINCSYLQCTASTLICRVKGQLGRLSIWYSVLNEVTAFERGRIAREGGCLFARLALDMEEL